VGETERITVTTNQMVQQIGLEYTKDAQDIPKFGPGDTVRLSLKVVEGTRERIQVYEGVVLRRRNTGVNENFTVRRIGAHGVGVERTFLLHSPRIDKIEITRRGIVHRATLYHLRQGSGKANRIKERKVAFVPKAQRSPAVQPPSVAATPVVDTNTAEAAAQSAGLTPAELKVTQVEATGGSTTVEQVEASDSSK